MEYTFRNMIRNIMEYCRSERKEETWEGEVHTFDVSFSVP
jgi:hypothetical protein